MIYHLLFAYVSGSVIVSFWLAAITQGYMFFPCLMSVFTTCNLHFWRFAMVCWALNKWDLPKCKLHFLTTFTHTKKMVDLKNVHFWRIKKLWKMFSLHFDVGGIQIWTLHLRKVPAPLTRCACPGCAKQVNHWNDQAGETMATCLHEAVGTSIAHSRPA